MCVLICAFAPMRSYDLLDKYMCMISKKTLGIRTLCPALSNNKNYLSLGGGNTV